jgi:hypothetical protein
MDQESIVLEVDPRSVLAAIKQANQAVEGWEKQTIGSGDKMQKSLERMSEMLLKMNDRSRSSMERLTQSIEKQAAAYGKTGVERLIADRDRLIKKLGDEQGMIDRVTAAYATMIAAESGGGAGRWQQFGDAVKSGVQNPLQAASGAVTGFLEKLGPVGIAVSAGATALVAFGAAAFGAMKSLGEYGVSVKDAELRIGLTAKEVGQFGFAARAAGQDISIFERMMRGLTEAVEDDSEKGENARGWLKRFGVDLGEVRNGTVSTSQVLLQIAGGLEQLRGSPDPFAEKKAMLDLFKRAGIEAIPVMAELVRNQKLAQEEGFGPTEGDLARFMEYQRQVTVLETKWAGLKRTFQEGLVIELNFAGNAAKWLADHIPGETVHWDDEMATRLERSKELADDIRRANAAKWGNAAPPNVIAAMERRRLEALRGLRPEDAFGPAPGQQDYRDPEAVRKLSDAAQWQQRIEYAQKKLAADAEAAKQAQVSAAGDEADRLRARYFGGHDALEKAYTDAKKDVEKYQQQLAHARDDKKSLEEVRGIGANLAGAVAREAQAKAALDAVKKSAEDARHAAEQLKEFRTQAAEFEKKGDEAELGAVGKIYYQRDLLLKQAEHLKGVEADVAAIRKSADEQAGVAFNKIWAEFTEYDEKRASERNRKALAVMMPSKEQMKEWEEGFAAQERIDSINMQSRRDKLSREAGQAQKVVGLSGMTGMDAIRATYQIRIDLAKELAAVEAERISKEESAAKRSVEIAQAQKDLQKAMDEAREEALMKQLELQKQQLEVLKRDTEGLWNTLLTHPSKFPKQLGDTVHAAVIKPVAEGMAGMTAKVLQPIIYGADGGGGIAGVFKGVFGGGKQDPMKAATDMNTAVTVQNSAALATLTAILAGAMGMAPPAIAAPGGIGGFSLPAISAPAVSGGGVSAGPSFSELANLPVGHGGFNPLAMVLGGGSGAAGTSANLPTLNRASSGGGGGLLRMILGGGQQGGAAGYQGGSGGGMPGGIAGIIKGFKGTNWGGFTHSATTPIYGTDENGNDVQTGTSGGGINGVNGVAGAALAGGGMMLAQQGLLGSSRGTWGGVAEGTAGGAMIGMQMGGPLGAVIGAVAGFGIGIGEKLAGVESPENEAKRLVKQLYGVSIDTAMAKQIVSIAQSKYAGHVSIAVRDPEVRKMLELYAQGTGQKMPLSATTPRGGSLAEMGGNLYQQASYVNGTPYTFQSSLPVLGGLGGGTYQAPGSPNAAAGMGPTYVSLNIGGADAANFMTGQFVTPGFVSSQMTAAQNSSDGRTQQSANMQVPGLVVS